MGEQKWRVDPEKPRNKFTFMSMKRLIARLDIKGQNVIKGVQMDGQRIVGDPAELASKYYEAGIDEIVYLDTVASLYGRENMTSIVEQVAQSIFVPLTVGGGIRSLDDARLMLRSGADKVAINSAAVSNPRLLQEVSSTRHLSWPGACGSAKQKTRVIQVFQIEHQYLDEDLNLRRKISNPTSRNAFSSTNRFSWEPK